MDRESLSRLFGMRRNGGLGKSRNGSGEILAFYDCFYGVEEIPKIPKVGESLKLWCFLGNPGILEIFNLRFQLVVGEISYGFEISQGA